MQLSISLLVSDRTDTLKRCLDSLMPILASLTSELIIVYTGKEKDNLKLVRQYTDHILFFDWCDDFSAARNCGLKQAEGDWFLYIDDDEWFEDCSEIITFFRSGEYKKYRSASYRQRNYDDRSGTSYTDIDVTRIVKLTPDTKFTGSIHEWLSMAEQPERVFRTFVHHYGYAKDNIEGLRSRFRRNVSLLEREIQKDPDNTRYYVQMAQEYKAAGQYRNAGRYCQRILERDVAMGETAYKGWAQVYLLVNLICSEEYGKALEEGRKFLESGGLSKLTELCIDIHMVMLCRRYECYEEGIGFADSFRRLRTYLDEEPGRWNEDRMLDVNQSTILRDSYSLYTSALLCLAHLELWEKVTDYLQYFPWDTQEMKMEFYEFFENFKLEFMDKRAEIIKNFMIVETEDSYVTFQKALFYEMEHDLDKAEKYYQRCSATGNEQIRYQIFLMALRCKFALPDFLADMDLDAWKVCASEAAEHSDFSDYGDYCIRTEELRTRYQVFYDIFTQKILSGMLFELSLEEGEFDLTLREYCRVVLDLNHTLYKDDLFGESMRYCLPIECRVALEFTEVFNLLDCPSLDQAVQRLKEIVSIYPDTAVLVNRLLSKLETKVSHMYTSEELEFKKLKHQIKAVLRRLMEDRKYKEAFPIADQLFKLAPEDLEVYKWRQELRKGST